MRHIFIINPAAGKRDCAESMRTMIGLVCRKCGIEPLIFMSEYKGYEREMTEKLCDLFPDERLRFYSIGGSGTLSNIISGIRDFSTTEVACYPTGLSNDFLKSYGKNTSQFRSLEALINGRVDHVDMIDANGYRAMVFSCFGLGNSCFSDALIFKVVSAIKPHLTYTLSILIDLLKNKCGKYRIDIDGRDCTGEYAMVACFNGICMGGNVMPLKDARPNDGTLNFILVSKMSRLKQLRTLGDFARGKLEKHKNNIRLINGHHAEITRDDGKQIAFNSDGECVRGLTNVVKVAPEKLLFVVPEGAEIPEPTQLDPRSLF